MDGLRVWIETRFGEILRLRGGATLGARRSVCPNTEFQTETGGPEQADVPVR